MDVYGTENIGLIPNQEYMEMKLIKAKELVRETTVFSYPITNT
jgi:hypothetical protein